MMKFLMIMMFLNPLCFMKNMFWLVQMILSLMMFLVMNLSSELNIFCNVSYMLSCDMMSYGLMLIIGWGYQPERIKAKMYLLFYTLFVFLPLLVGILYIYKEMGSMMIYF